MESTKCHKLYAFGFNAFGQLSKRCSTKVMDRHTNVSRILMTTWESTFVLTDQRMIEIWGFTNARLQALVTYWNKTNLASNKTTLCIYGDLQVGLGTIDDTGNAVWWDIQKDTFDVGNGLLLGENITDAGLCHGLNRLYLLSGDGKVQEYDIEQCNQVKELLIPTKVTSMAISTTHVLFGVEGSAPVYGLGSNRMGQLGMDTGTIQHVDRPMVLDFFDGLGTMGNDKESGVKVACGPFHSAVILHNDLYTLGWNDQGRLGWGSLAGQDLNDADPIRLASFINDDGQDIDVLVDKVCCGTNHTVVIDVDGYAWTCGSDKYSQLGRSIVTTNNDDGHDDYFRQCKTKEDTMIECDSGPWSTFLQTS
ncbi:regulator of chromosome condensation 1/beta-lactamase-inhibitor protein II [Chlamydoabsidia padenii]|nr:regulator of chromosome condensation 1/beta-lactamase-inhibitor protein II [Chlamydoabsidia padenii]